jgi:Terminase large subunit, T4likevirus-type, N-terminal
MNLQIEPEKIKQLIADLEAEANEDKLASYKPYLKQVEFHAAGAKHRERLLMAGNQLGKTLAGAMETAIHATGRYPSWWRGKRFDKPTISWVAGTTGETVRDTVQRMLIGRAGQEGTSAIPKDAIAELVPARGIADLLDGIKARANTNRARASGAPLAIDVGMAARWEAGDFGRGRHSADAAICRCWSRHDARARAIRGW